MQISIKYILDFNQAVLLKTKLKKFHSYKNTLQTTLLVLLTKQQMNIKKIIAVSALTLVSVLCVLFDSFHSIFPF